MVQIIGCDPSMSKQGEESKKKGDPQFVSDKQTGLSASPVVVRPRKDISDLLKK